MVRHEAAEALGGIATPDVLPHLKEWATRPDAPRVVKESCEIALDMYEVSVEVLADSFDIFDDIYLDQYENSGAFQYADGLDSASLPVATAA